MDTHPKHVVVIGAVLLASWLVSNASSRPAAPPAPRDDTTRQTPARDAAVDELAQDVVRETVRLQDRLADAPQPRRSGRDPFRFGAARAVRLRDAVARPVEPEAAPAALPVPVQAAVPYKLIGIAENAAADGSVERRAILSGAGELVIVGVDDGVGTRFVVVAVGADAVELFDASVNQPVRLTLR